MPTYGYVCDNPKCKYEFEIHQSMSEEALVKCPACNKDSLVKKIYAPMIFIKNEPTTIGHQAARNTEKMGHYEYEDRLHQRNKRVQRASEEILKETGGKNIERTGELPWWRSGEVTGFPRKEKPITVQEAQKVADEIGIKVSDKKPPKLRKKKVKNDG